MVFSVFLESLILTVCWYGTGRFINSKVTPHVRKSWGCEGFRTLRRESRFSSLLWDLLWRSFCQDDDAEKENWDRVVVHAFSSQSHYGLSQLTLRHFHYSLLNTLPLPYTYYKGYIPTSSQSLSCRCQWTPMDPCPQHKIIDNLVIVTKMSTTLPISMFLLEWINNMSRSTSSNQT